MSIELAREHGLEMAQLAADKCGDNWKVAAMSAFKNYAESHSTFTTEDVRLANDNIHTGGDPRAWGSIAQSAKKMGIIEFCGYKPVTSSNGSAKVLWRSLIAEKSA
jgi:hypothetical protein